MIGPFKSRRLLATILIASLAVVSAFVSRDLAAAEKSQKVEECHGTNMLSELSVSNPKLYADVMRQASEQSNTKAVLWKIEKQGLAPSHLFGTMHLSDSRIAKLSSKTASAIKGSKSVALEVADLSDGAVKSGLAKAAELLVFTDGRNLQNLLTEEEFAKVKAVISKSGMPGEFAGVFKPWLVNMLLALSDCERKKVAAGAPVLDMKVAEAAQANDIPVVGLETVRQQLSALADVPEDQQLQMLKVGLKYVDRADDMIETLIHLYLGRNLGAALPFQVALAAIHDTPASAFEGFEQSLLVKRNAKMRDAALPLLNSGGAFIAVGALHLPGDTGLVELFRREGFTVTAIE